LQTIHQNNAKIVLFEFRLTTSNALLVQTTVAWEILQTTQHHNAKPVNYYPGLLLTTLFVSQICHFVGLATLQTTPQNSAKNVFIILEPPLTTSNV